MIATAGRAVLMLCLLLAGPLQASGSGSPPAAEPGTAQAAPAARASSTELLRAGKFARAAEAARSALDTDPESRREWLNLAEARRETGDEEGAARAYEEALARDEGEDPWPLVELARLDLRAGRVTRATERALQVLAVHRAAGARPGRAVLVSAAHAAHLLARDDPSLYQVSLRLFEDAIERYPEDPGLRVDLGLLLLEKYNNAEARDLFDEALQLDSNRPETLLALARSEQFDESPSALDLAQKVVEMRPGWVRARALLARLALNTHDFETAERHLAAALAVNPDSTRALAVEAAIGLLHADEARTEAALKRALAAAPGDPEPFVTLAEIAVRNRLYPEAVKLARDAISVDHKAWRAYGILGLNRLRLGQIRGARRDLELAFEGDPYNVWVKNTLDLLDKMDAFETISSERFELVADPAEARALAAYLLPLAERAYDHYAERYSHRPATPIRIEVFPRHEDFSVRTVGLVGVDILGASFGPVITMDSPSTRAFGPVNWAAVLWHEISHSFHLSLSRNRVPRWFTEGLAVLEEHNARAGWGGDVTPSFLIAYRRGELPAASELEQSFQRPATSEEVGHSYYLSYLLLDFIQRQYGAEAIVRMLEGFGEGRSANDLVGAVTGLYGRGLDGALERYIDVRFGDSIAALTPLVDLEAISTDEAATPYEVLYTGGLQSLRDGDLDTAQTSFEKAAALFPEHAGQGSAYHQLAEIYRKRGDTEKAIGMYETIARINADDLEAHQALVELYLQSDDERALGALERLLLIDPFDAAQHQRLAELFEAREEWSNASRERAAVLALDPTDKAGAHYALARALTREGALQDARREVLRSLEIAPLFDDGLELLLEVHDRLAAPQPPTHDGSGRVPAKESDQ